MNHPQWLVEALASNPDWSLGDAYRACRDTPSDINEHVPTIEALAADCLHVTEMGTRCGVSLIALLHGRPHRAVAFDAQVPPTIRRLRAFASAAGVDFRFRQEDTLAATIEPTDLLLLDTLHTFAQLYAELRLHAARVHKWIVCHDTTTFADVGEDGKGPGLWAAVSDFLGEQRRVWELHERHENCNGLTILRRKDGR